MWWSTTSAAVVVVPTVAAIHYHRQKNDIVKRLNKIRTSRDAVRLLQDLSVDTSTEEVTEQLANTIALHADHISDATVCRLSRLAQEHKDDFDMHGYAVTLIWSCVVAACKDDILAFSD